MTQARRASSISIACVCAAGLFFADLRAAAAETIQPSQQTAFVFPTGLQSKTVPIRIISGQILMRLAIGDRGLDLVLDSGSPANILDPSVFDGLPTSGDASSIRTVESTRIGDVTVNGLVFQSLPFFRRLDQATTVVGILGYGFLGNAVVKIDYDGENVELIDAEHFTPPADGAFEVPVDLTARIPLARATLGSVSGDRFVIDTGATTDVVFAQFSNRNPAQFSPDHELHDSESYRYLRQYFPLCGTSEHSPFSVPSMSVGEAGVRDWVVWKPDERSCFQTRWDGLVGYDFLPLFTVYFDCPRSRVIFQPNDLYRSASNTIKP